MVRLSLTASLLSFVTGKNELNLFFYKILVLKWTFLNIFSIWWWIQRNAGCVCVRRRFLPFSTADPAAAHETASSSTRWSARNAELYENIRIRLLLPQPRRTGLLSDSCASVSLSVLAHDGDGARSRASWWNRSRLSEIYAVYKMLEAWSRRLMPARIGKGR